MSLASTEFPGWHFDRRISAAFAVTLAAQLGAMVWFASGQHAVVGDHDRRIASIEAAVHESDRIRDGRWIETTERFTRLEDGQDEIKRALGVAVMPRGPVSRRGLPAQP